jgi:hypothetical protein
MHYWTRDVCPLRYEPFLDETQATSSAGRQVAGNAEREGSRVSTRTGGQIERLLWAAAEARRVRVDREKVAVRPVHLSVVVTPIPEQFTTEWQTAYLPEPA